MSKRYTVPAGVPGEMIRDREEVDAVTSPQKLVTKRENTFTEEEVIVHPSGEPASPGSPVKYGPAHATVGGAYARAGYIGFEPKGVGCVLFVPASCVIEID